MTNSGFAYPEESDITQLRKGFKLTSDGYLSKNSLLYIIETVQDLYNEDDFAEALAAKAAHILFKIATSHPFIDGNKRTAFGTADLFLRLNEHFIKVDPEEGRDFVVKMTTGKVAEDTVRKWVTTFKEAIGIRHIMTYAVTKPTKGQIKKAIEGNLKDNAKLYELLEKYDEKVKAKATKSA